MENENIIYTPETIALLTTLHEGARAAQVSYQINWNENTDSFEVNINSAGFNKNHDVSNWGDLNAALRVVIAWTQGLNKKPEKPKARDISDVIDQLKEKIPADNEEFLKRLDWVKNDSCYRPPEDQSLSWKFLIETIGTFLPEHQIASKWQCEVLSIYSTKPLAGIMEHFKITDNEYGQG